MYTHYQWGSILYLHVGSSSLETMAREEQNIFLSLYSRLRKWPPKRLKNGSPNRIDGPAELSPSSAVRRRQCKVGGYKVTWRNRTEMWRRRVHFLLWAGEYQQDFTFFLRVLFLLVSPADTLVTVLRAQTMTENLKRNRCECVCVCVCFATRWKCLWLWRKVQWHTGEPAVGALERGEAARERRLQLGGQEDAQLGDDAACDELVRGHVERRVPHLHACRQDRGEKVKSCSVPLWNQFHNSSENSGIQAWTKWLKTFNYWAQH